MNEMITIFTNKEFGEVRMIEIDGIPYFVGKDVADILGYSNTRDALAKHVDDEDKNTVAIRDGKGNPNQTVITESGVYSLIFSSQLPEAKKFKRWVAKKISIKSWRSRLQLWWMQETETRINNIFR